MMKTATRPCMRSQASSRPHQPACAAAGWRKTLIAASSRNIGSNSTAENLDTQASPKTMLLNRPARQPGVSSRSQKHVTLASRKKTAALSDVASGACASTLGSRAYRASAKSPAVAPKSRRAQKKTSHPVPSENTSIRLRPAMSRGQWSKPLP
jgi:hypothetical protein